MATFYNILYNGISGGKVNFLKPRTDKEIKESIERIIQKSKRLHAKPYIPPENTEFSTMRYQRDEEIADSVERHCSKSNQSYTWPVMTGDKNEPTDYASQQYFPDKDPTHSPHEEEENDNEQEDEDIEYERQLEQEWIEHASTAAYDYFVDNGIKYKNRDFTGKRAGSYLRRDVEEPDE